MDFTHSKKRKNFSTSESAQDHVQSCEDCNPVSHLILRRQSRLISIFGGLSFSKVLFLRKIYISNIEINMFGFKKKANLDDLRMHCIHGQSRCKLVIERLSRI